MTLTIPAASLVADAPVMAIRTGEVINALATCLAEVLALCPDMDVASHLRAAVDRLAERIQRDAARARAAGVADILGAARQGHA